MEARAYTCLLFVASTTGGHFWPSNDRCAFEYSSWLAANDLARQLIEYSSWLAANDLARQLINSE
jgi:hypothetical protein